MMPKDLPRQDHVGRALDWIVRHLPEFDPARSDSPPQPADLQAIAELAIAASLHARSGGAAEGAALQSIVTFLEEIHENPALRDRVVRFPEELIPLGDLTGALLALGHRHADQLALLQRILDAGLLDHEDRSLHSRMELRLCIDSAGLQHRYPSLTELGGQVPPPPALLTATRGDVYTFTHLIMFSTDFGALPPPVTGGLSDPGELARVLSALLVRYAHEEYFDLLAELLLCWDCLRLTPTPLTEAAWRVFLAAQEPDGSFPVGKQASSPSAQEAKSGDHAYFRLRYHTTLLAIINIPLRQERERCRALTAAVTVSSFPRAGRKGSLSPSLARGHAWVMDLLEKAHAMSPSALRYLLLAWWIQRSSSGESRGGPLELPITLERRLLDPEIAPVPADGSAPLTLAMITEAILSRRQAPRMSPSSFLEAVVSAVRKASTADPTIDLMIYEKQLLLHRMGLLPEPMSVGHDELISFAQRSALLEGGRGLDPLLARIESSTKHGSAPVHLTSSEEWIVDALRGSAQDALRRYDWPRGCRALRALAYLERGFGPSFDECLTFLALNQRADGAFGYFGPDARKLGAAGDPAAFDLAATLPVTVEVLWTLAEVTSQDHWRLYSSLPRPSIA